MNRQRLNELYEDLSEVQRLWALATNKTARRAYDRLESVLIEWIMVCEAEVKAS